MNVCTKPRLAVAVCLAAFTNSVQADAIEIVKVEERWSVEVGQPNLVANAPQISMIMSPHADLDYDFFVFLINHRTQPSYAPGGSQVQLWDGDFVEDYRNHTNESPLNQDGEVITWTQVMSVDSGTVSFEVRDGSSQSWGGFGGQGLLKTSVTTGQSNLNTYSPVNSIQQSSIGFAGNRIVSLTLEQITWHLSDGRTYTQYAPIDIDTDLSPWDDTEVSSDEDVE